MMKIRVTLASSFPTKILSDKDGPHVILDGVRAKIPPHLAGRNFGPQDILTFIVEHLDSVGASVIASYLYEHIKSGTFTQIFIQDEEVTSEPTSVKDYELLIKALLEEE